MDLRITYDASVDIAYLYLASPVRGSVAFTHPCDDDDKVGLDGEIMLDVGHDRKVLGVEFLKASTLLPAELLAAADRPPKSG